MENEYNWKLVDDKYEGVTYQLRDGRNKPIYTIPLMRSFSEYEAVEKSIVNELLEYDQLEIEENIKIKYKQDEFDISPQNNKLSKRSNQNKLSHK